MDRISVMLGGWTAQGGTGKTPRKVGGQSRVTNAPQGLGDPPTCVRGPVLAARRRRVARDCGDRRGYGDGGEVIGPGELTEPRSLSRNHNNFRWRHSQISGKRPTNVRRTPRRFPLGGRRVGQRGYRLGFIAAGATFQGSTASKSARVVACGIISKIKRR